jgi:hypothetical protein
MARQDDVRRARQVFRVQPESISPAMKRFSQDEFWTAVLGFDARHDEAASVRRYMIHLRLKIRRIGRSSQRCGNGRTYAFLARARETS